MSLTETAALGGLLFGFAGLILSVMNYMRSRSNSEAMIADTQKARRANASSEFLKEYYGPEFMVVRSEAWNVGFEFCEKNKKASKQVALYLIGDKDFDPRSNNVPIAELGPNNQTPLQNLSRVVNFWHRIAVYTRLKLVDREILTPLGMNTNCGLLFLAKSQTLLTTTQLRLGRPNNRYLTGSLASSRLANMFGKMLLWKVLKLASRGN